MDKLIEIAKLNPQWFFILATSVVVSVPITTFSLQTNSNRSLTISAPDLLSVDLRNTTNHAAHAAQSLDSGFEEIEETAERIRQNPYVIANPDVREIVEEVEKISDTVDRVQAHTEEALDIIHSDLEIPEEVQPEALPPN